MWTVVMLGCHGVSFAWKGFASRIAQISWTLLFIMSPHVFTTSFKDLAPQRN